jgi:hypothetical protein
MTAHALAGSVRLVDRSRIRIRAIVALEAEVGQRFEQQALASRGVRIVTLGAGTCLE